MAELPVSSLRLHYRLNDVFCKALNGRIVRLRGGIEIVNMDSKILL